MAKHGTSPLLAHIHNADHTQVVPNPKFPAPFDRYLKEIRRVSGVLDTVLAGHKYLVGGKYTFADLAFLTWQTSIIKIIKYDQAKDFPNV